jgi:hypothetical protein
MLLLPDLVVVSGTLSHGTDGPARHGASSGQPLDTCPVLPTLWDHPTPPTILPARHQIVIAVGILQVTL